jgi:hypothetical protein
VRAQHTAGPWRVELWKYDDGKRIVPTVQNDSDAVAQITDLWCPDDRTAERDANARLIASAPDMLASLQQFAAAYVPADDAPMRWEDMNEAYQRALEVIARATGEPAA